MFSTLIDDLSRKVDYLRLSVIVRGNFRGIYGVFEDMTLLPQEHTLNFKEIQHCAALLLISGG